MEAEIVKKELNEIAESIDKRMTAIEKGQVKSNDLESIKKETISSKMFNHLSVDGTGWYNNRHIHFFLTLSVPLFPPMLLLLVIGLWLNQTRSQGWLWHTDKRLVITNLIFLLPIP